MNTKFISENEVNQMESRENQEKKDLNTNNKNNLQASKLHSEYKQELSDLKESKLENANQDQNLILNRNSSKNYSTIESNEKAESSKNQNCKIAADLKSNLIPNPDSKETDLLLKKENLDSANGKNNNNRNNSNYVLEQNNNSSVDKSRYDTKVTSISIELEENPSLFALFKGLIFMLLSCVFKSTFSVLSKYAMKNIKNLSSYQLMAFRTYFMLFICVIVAFVSKIQIFSAEFMKADKVFSVFLRTVLAIVEMSLVVYSIEHLYVSDVYSVYFIYPAFLTVFSVIFFKEKIKKLDVLCLLACFVGVILVVKPNFIFNHNLNLKIENATNLPFHQNTANILLTPLNQSNAFPLHIHNNNTLSSSQNTGFTNFYNLNNTFINFKNLTELTANKEKEFDNKGFYLLLVVVAALLKAMEDFVMKDIGKQVHFLAFPFLYTFIGIIMFPIPMLLLDNVFAEFTKFDVLLIFSIGLCTFIYISFMALGYQNESAGRVSMVNYFQIIFMYLSDLFLFDKRLELLELLGTLLIFGFNFANGLLKTLKRKEYLDKHINKINNKNDL